LQSRFDPFGQAKIWLGWQDSNLRMLGSKPSALPLGDTPIIRFPVTPATRVPVTD
jgi:hypothetical protein